MLASAVGHATPLGTPQEIIANAIGMARAEPRPCSISIQVLKGVIGEGVLPNTAHGFGIAAAHGFEPHVFDSHGVQAAIALTGETSGNEKAGALNAHGCANPFSLPVLAVADVTVAAQEDAEVEPLSDAGRNASSQKSHQREKMSV
jgi:hypothetical protein